MKVEGLKEAIDLLNFVARGQLINNALDEYSIKVVAATSPYIAKPPQSTYRRTNRMLRSWYRQGAKSKRVLIGNRAPYSGWVQQKATQAWMHRQHGWHTIEDKADATPNLAVFWRSIDRQLKARAR